MQSCRGRGHTWILASKKRGSVGGGGRITAQLEKRVPRREHLYPPDISSLCRKPNTIPTFLPYPPPHFYLLDASLFIPSLFAAGSSCLCTCPHQDPQAAQRAARGPHRQCLQRPPLRDRRRFPLQGPSQAIRGRPDTDSILGSRLSWVV